MWNCNEYGEREIITPYCEEISFEEIENRAVRVMEDFRTADKVFLSNDLYADLLKQCSDKTQYRSQNIGSLHVMRVHTTAGTLDVVRVPLLCNFCLVGTEADFNLVERAKIDKAFEEIVFDGKSDVCGGPTSEDNKLPTSVEVPAVVKPTNHRG